MRRPQIESFPRARGALCRCDERGEEGSETSVMVSNEIPDMGDFWPRCVFSGQEHLSLARAFKDLHPEIFEWMSRYPDGISEATPGATENYKTLHEFVDEKLPGCAASDKVKIGYMLFVAATLTPPLYEKFVQKYEEKKRQQLRK